LLLCKLPSPEDWLAKLDKSGQSFRSNAALTKLFRIDSSYAGTVFEYGLMTQLTADSLLNIGFRDVAKWVLANNGGGIAYELDGTNATAHRAMLDVRNALYAFVHGETLNYIGKTARSIKKRFIGYCNPGSAQVTNQRCHALIKAACQQSKETRIFVFTPISDLSYGEFRLDLAAGLEESLIVAFAPPWNGREGTRLLTEEAEREVTEEFKPGRVNTNFAFALEPSAPHAALASPPTNRAEQATFQIRLGTAYYNQGLINPGIEASQFLGEDGDPVIVYLGTEFDQVDSGINRSANLNGSVRIIGNNRRIAEWFQHHFKLGDAVEAVVLDPQHVVLRLPRIV
jgi:hypothetical protein